jgi:hypothetical protein
VVRSCWDSLEVETKKRAAGFDRTRARLDRRWSYRPTLW